jgi:glycosyltransferase involved in cell wall biosynthesis
LKNKLIVYDVEDTYIDQLIILPFFRFFGIFMERFLMKFADAVILIDEMQNEEFGSIPNKNIVVIYDSPYDINRPSLNSVKKSLGKKDFKIFYAGNLNKKRNLHIESLLEAIEDIEDVEVTIVGEGDLVETIQIKAHEMPNKIHYMKWMSYIQVLEMSCQADLLFSLRDPYPLVQKYICGSKFLESLMCGKPILVNKSTSTAFKVVKNKCGIVVDANNVEEIKKAILKLKNNEEFYKSLKLNARKTYDQQYSWKIMENRLLILYNNLLKINKVERYLSF